MPLALESVNPRLVSAEYAVRGELAVRAETLRTRLAEASASGVPSGLPFDTVISANIGNPQQLGQRPITFFRQVTSLVENPALLDNPDVLAKSFGYEADAIDRARTLLSDVQSVGAYSHSQGVPAIRHRVADFIADRDGHAANPDHIFLTSGASAGASAILFSFFSSPSSGVLVPIPQYPLYTATLSLLGSQCVPYFLDESAGWATSVTEIEAGLDRASAAGTSVGALVVINPGNPTGAILSRDLMEQLLNLAARHDLLIIADEVYQANVFSGQFLSFKKVLREMQSTQTVPKIDSVQLVSLQSISKGTTGECGHRGGYMELVGFDDAVLAQVYKYFSIQLCPSVVGQCLVDLMVRPPREGEPSYALYRSEVDSIASGLRERATGLWKAFSGMAGVECREPEGAMYLFPTITLPAKAIAAAVAANKPADDFYCLRLLDATGICIVPGSGFGQREGTLHFRTTFLAPGTVWVDRWVRFHADFMAEFADA